MLYVPTCLFCRIAAHEVEAPIVYEDEHTAAFLDARPLFAGHTLLVPKLHVETLPELPAGAVGGLFTRAQDLCRAIEQAMQAEGTFVAINNRISQSVRHLHVHIVPRRTKDGLKGFFWPRTKYRDAGEAEAVRAAISNVLVRLKTSAHK